LVGTKDNVIPVAEQRVMAKRAGSHVAEVPASHMSMVSHPQQVAAIIMTAAAAR
jgi:pimeloyl-ACP methyl ester carboxylesterase